MNDSFLTPIKPVKTKWHSGRTKYAWLFRCVCGNEILRTKNQVSSGKVKSCGCRNHKGHVKPRCPDPKDPSINALFNRHTQTSRKRGIFSNLTREDFIDLIFSKCYYCGIPPCSSYNVYRTRGGKKTAKNSERYSQCEILVNGIDRVDSNSDYEVINSVSCCRTCNFAKNDLSYGDFIKWVKRISSNLPNLE